MSNQSEIQASVRSATGTEYTYEGDWHALFDSASISAGTFNERLLSFINQQTSGEYSNLQDAKNAFAISQGFDNWNSINSLLLATDYLFVATGQSNADRLFTIDSGAGAAAMVSVMDAYWTTKTNAGVNGATSGSALLARDCNDPLTEPYWYNDETQTFGPAWDNFVTAFASYKNNPSYKVKFIVWAQGENFPTNWTLYKQYLKFVLDAIRSHVGGEPIIIIAPIGRRTDTVTTNFNYQKIRNVQKEVCAENPTYIFRAPESVDQEYGNPTQHLLSYVTYGQRIARFALSKYSEFTLNKLRVVSVQNKAHGARTTRGVTNCCVRWPHIVSSDCDTIAFTFNNWYLTSSGTSATGNALTIVSASVECPSGTVVPVTFSGQRGVTLVDGAEDVVSDEILDTHFPLGVKKGDVFFVKVMFSLSSSAHYAPYAGVDTASGSLGALVGWYNPANTTPSSVDSAGQWTATGTAFDSRTNGFYPIMIGRTKTDDKSYVAIGSSTTAGTGDSITGTDYYYGAGYFQRALKNDGTDLRAGMQITLSGSASTMLSSGTHWQSLLKYARFCVDQSGANEIPYGSDLSTIQSRTTAIWSKLRDGGIEKIIRVRLSPRTTSTDSWATSANQTPVAEWTSVGIAGQLHTWMQEKLSGGYIDSYVSANDVRDSNQYLWRGSDSTPPAVSALSTDGTHMTAYGHGLFAEELITEFDIIEASSQFPETVPIPVIGYNFTSVERNGTALTAYTDVPAGTNILGSKGIYIADDPADPHHTEITYSDLAIDNTAKKITLTLSSVPTGATPTFYNIFNSMNGLGTDYADVFHDNATYGLPLTSAQLVITDVTPTPTSVLGGLFTEAIAEWEASSGSNLITSPYDGSSQSAYNGTWGGTLAPASGGLPAYNTSAGIVIPATTFIQNLGNDKSWTFIGLMVCPASWTSNTLLTCGGNNSTTNGLTFRHISGSPGNFRFVTSDGSTGPSNNLTGEYLDTTANRTAQLFAFSYNASTKAWKASMLGTSFTHTGTHSGPNGSGVVSVATTATLMGTGQGAWSGLVGKVLSDSEIASVKAAINTKYSLSL